MLGPSRRGIAGTAALAFLVGIAAPAHATPILVLNPSFESPPQADGMFTTDGIITDWTTNPNGGVFNPVTGVHYSGPGATDGVQVAYSNGGIISQVLGATL